MNVCIYIWVFDLWPPQSPWTCTTLCRVISWAASSAFTASSSPLCSSKRRWVIVFISHFLLSWWGVNPVLLMLLTVHISWSYPNIHWISPDIFSDGFIAFSYYKCTVSADWHCPEPQWSGFVSHGFGSANAAEGQVVLDLGFFCLESGFDWNCIF